MSNIGQFCNLLHFKSVLAVIYLTNFLHMQERFYFGDHVLPLFETGIPLLKQRLHQFPESDKVCSIRTLIVSVKYSFFPVINGMTILLLL